MRHNVVLFCLFYFYQIIGRTIHLFSDFPFFVSINTRFPISILSYNLRRIKRPFQSSQLGVQGGRGTGWGRLRRDYIVQGNGLLGEIVPPLPKDNGRSDSLISRLGLFRRTSWIPARLENYDFWVGTCRKPTSHKGSCWGHTETQYTPQDKGV